MFRKLEWFPLKYPNIFHYGTEMYTFGTSMYFQGTNMQSLRAKVCFFEGYCPNDSLGHFLPFVWQCAMIACLAFCWYPVKVSYVNCINTEIELP